MHTNTTKEETYQEVDSQQKETDFSAAQAIVTSRTEKKTATEIGKRAKNSKDENHSQTEYIQNRRELAAAQVVVYRKAEKTKNGEMDDPSENEKELEVIPNLKGEEVDMLNPTQAQCPVDEYDKSDTTEQSDCKKMQLENINQCQYPSQEVIQDKEKNVSFEEKHIRSQESTTERHHENAYIRGDNFVKGIHLNGLGICRSIRMMDYDASEQLYPDKVQYQSSDGVDIAFKDTHWYRMCRPPHQGNKSVADCKLDIESIKEWFPFIFEERLSDSKALVFPQRNDIIAYPVTNSRNGTFPQHNGNFAHPVTLSENNTFSCQWLLRCRQIDLRVEVNDAMNEENDLTPVFPESRLTLDWDIVVFPRPLTVDHLVVHISNRLFEIRQAENMTVIHDKSPGSTFERSENVVEGRDYDINEVIEESLRQRFLRCTLSNANGNGRITMFEMPAPQFKITDVILQTLLKHPGILQMDTAVIQNGKLKIFMENFDAALTDVNGPWGDQDILHLLFRLLEAVGNLHKNEIVLLDINDKTLVLKNSTDPTTVAICKFSSAQFDSNKLIPLEFNESSPKYPPPEWWHILQLQEYSHVMKKVDSWQIGCLLMKLLLGEDPQLVHLIPMRHDDRFIDNHFEERNIIESRRLIQREIARRIRRRIVHPNLKKIIFGFLEPCPSRRMSVEEALGLIRQSSDSPHGI